MIIEKNRKILTLSILAVGMSALLFLWKHLTYFEPPFAVTGSKDVLSKMHVNVYMFRYESKSSMRTIFLKGNAYPSDNQEVDRFEFYINYDNKLFSHYGYDNVPRMVNDSSIARNTLLICKKGSDIYFSNRSMKCDELKDQNKLRPLEEQLGIELAGEKKSGSIKTKTDEESFIRNTKSSFFDITKPAS
ncbi:hypothetical protein [Paraburkholderia sp. J76]|uniref:hypothetical protein n=1 Tax=Paraburkholderia sp. J76 TaxID=2805439 RepID=UPI002ABD3856|nr:hypothetical protein [Paraburkholderia sp. J76]